MVGHFKRKLVVAVFALSSIFVAVSAANGASDPRVCVAGSELVCARSAATLALKRQMTVYTGRKVWKLGPIACISPGGSLVVWFCDWPGAHSTISFRERSGAWQTTVRVLCRASGTRPETGCQ